MNALVTASARFVQTDDGALWTHNPAIRYDFWTRYLDVYDHVRILARARTAQEPPEGWWQATGDNVQGTPVSDFHSPLDYLRVRKSVVDEIRTQLADPAGLHLRLPCPLGTVVWRVRDSKRPYGVEVVGDPAEVFSRGAFQHPARALIKYRFAQNLRNQCARANAAAYVTESTLQKRYPPRNASMTTHFSSISLEDDAISEAPRGFDAAPDELRLVSVGTLEQLYKAPHVLIRAIAHLKSRGVATHLTLVGDGARRPELEALADELGIEDRVVFAGQLGPEQVRRELDAAHVFVLPSIQEGLPKAMIEAMARGLPCIGSTAGGIPELLSPRELVEPGDVEGLATSLEALAADPERLTRPLEREPRQGTGLSRAAAPRAANRPLRTRKRTHVEVARQQRRRGSSARGRLTCAESSAGFSLVI